MKIRTLTEIWIYPIKSMPGIRVSTGTVLQKGMLADRRFMLIDENNRFITLRELPNMSQLTLNFDENKIIVRSNNSNDSEFLEIPTQVESTHTINAVVWDDIVEVVEVNPDFSMWFSDHLKSNCRLVFFPEQNKRRVDPKYVDQDFHTSLSDGYPYLIIGRNSVKDLSDRVGQEMTMKRFRPNLVFDGGNPYEEDGWKEFKIGDVQFQGVKPCGRCIITTMNPETGDRSDEPLRTLATYRKENNKILFGLNVIAHNNGRINEGDEIIVS